MIIFLVETGLGVGRDSNGCFELARDEWEFRWEFELGKGCIGRIGEVRWWWGWATLIIIEMKTNPTCRLRLKWIPLAWRRWNRAAGPKLRTPTAAFRGQRNALRCLIPLTRSLWQTEGYFCSTYRTLIISIPPKRLKSNACHEICSLFKTRQKFPRSRTNPFWIYHPKRDHYAANQNHSHSRYRYLHDVSNHIRHSTQRWTPYSKELLWPLRGSSWDFLRRLLGRKLLGIFISFRAKEGIGSDRSDMTYMVHRVEMHVFVMS
jgi:hypothetical protein